MIAAIRSWWDHLGYSWNRKSPRGFRTFGLRPWRGAPFFWLIIDTSGTARRLQSTKHVETCEECRDSEVPTPQTGNTSDGSNG